MRGRVTPTARKLEGGAKRAHKAVFTFHWLINRLHFDTSSFNENKNVCGVRTRICIRVNAQTNI